MIEIDNALSAPDGDEAPLARSLRGVPRLSAAFALELAAKLKPYRALRVIPKIALLDKNAAEYVNLCARYKLAASANLECQSPRQAAALFESFAQSGHMDIAAVQKAKTVAEAERRKIDDFYKEAALDICAQCGRRRARPALAQAPGRAETLLGIMERWNRDRPLEKAVWHTLPLLKTDDKPKLQV